MISTKVIVGMAVTILAVGSVVAYRWVHPCADCPISAAIGMLGGPSGCAPANDAATTPTATASTASANIQPVANPTSKDSTSMTTTQGIKTETAMFGAGCFWGVEAIFRKIPGVVDTAVGYAGGTTTSPTYKQVCTHTTGHAEVVKVEFDPSKVTYEKLVEKFFKLHDPTQVNRQGPDYGTQYRSVVFFYSPEQEKTAQAVKQRVAASGKWKAPIATEITKAGEFWKAEDYHQRYLEKTGQDNCHVPLDDD